MGFDTMKVNEKGQITIPKEIRKNHGIKPGDTLIVQYVDGTIIFNKLTQELEETIKKLLEGETD